MYDDESRKGIVIYTVVFFVVLISFIGFLIYNGAKDSERDNSGQTKRAMLRSSQRGS